jgi:MoaA/NifB/PqqE/SkfB family radical SAM enzyme
LQSVVFISDKCNLQCKHCCAYAGSDKTPIINTYEEVKQKLKYCYKLGARFVDFEGGEPFL